MSLTDKELELRLGLITATNVGPIMGEGASWWSNHPSGELTSTGRPRKVKTEVTADTVMLKKLGMAEPFEGNEKTRWGDYLEEHVFPVWYFDTTGRYLRRPSEVLDCIAGNLVVGPEPWMGATPDYCSFVEVLGHHGLVECKYSEYKSGYGEPMTDEIPRQHWWQCQWQMACTGYQETEVVASVGGKPAQIWIVRKDWSVVDEMIDTCYEFYLLMLSNRVMQLEGGPVELPSGLTIKHPGGDTEEGI